MVGSCFSSRFPLRAPPPLPTLPLSQSAAASKDSASSLCANQALTNMINWVFLESSGGTQSTPEGRPGVRNVSCNLCARWACFPHSALDWGWAAVSGEPRKVCELQALPSLRMVYMKAEPETFITTTSGERLSFGSAGPTKTILFMCFQALKNSFRAHQWGVNRNFEIRKMPAG